MEIIWTKKAIESFKELAFYLNNSFGKDITTSQVGKVTRRVNDLLRNPLLGKEYESSNLLKYEFRFFVINKQTKVFYFIKIPHRIFPCKMLFHAYKKPKAQPLAYSG